MNEHTNGKTKTIYPSAYGVCQGYNSWEDLKVVPLNTGGLLIQVRPNKKISVVRVTYQKKLGRVGR